MSEKENQNSNDHTCHLCGLRQYSDICARCGVAIKDEEEQEKTKDDYDEYDWREKR